jgi:hypothetical protein
MGVMWFLAASVLQYGDEVTVVRTARRLEQLLQFQPLRKALEQL